MTFNGDHILTTTIVMEFFTVKMILEKDNWTKPLLYV